jgi:hypothetical protein
MIGHDTLSQLRGFVQVKEKNLSKVISLYLRIFVFNTLRHLLAFWLAIRSMPQFFRSLFKKDRVWIDREYNGEKVLLIALYQSEKLRPDIQRFLVQAKELGLYVIGVNNASIKDRGELFDCYIERFNYGRDFGSYQTGMLYLFSKGIEKKAKRLIMLNDSVFYESTRTKPFLKELMDTNIEVLGATENQEFDRHLGSFCLSFSSKILQHPKFKRFWRRFRKSDVRPYVIKRGELALSYLLKRIVSNIDQFRALYDVNALSEWLQEDKRRLDAALKYVRKSAIFSWPRLVAHEIWPQFLKEHYFVSKSIFKLKMWRRWTIICWQKRWMFSQKAVKFT